MKRLLVPIGILIVTVGLAACGAARSYRMPIDASQARETFSPIATCAERKGLMISEHPDSIHVKYDETAWIQYMIQNEQYNMVLIVDDKAVTGADLEAKFTEAQKVGDELYACAEQHMGAIVAANTALDEPAPVPTGGACAKLASCFAAISNSLCAQVQDTSCETSFKIEGDPDDPGCQEILDQIPMLIQPYKMAIPDYQTPGECL